MVFSKINARGLVMLGCGKMGSALLSGWMAAGLDTGAVYVIDPAPSDWVIQQGVRINAGLPANPHVALIAVKPQMMQTALPTLAPLRDGKPLVISIAAGTPIATFERILGTDTRVIRAMPNTPAAIGKAITAIIGNTATTPADKTLADTLLSTIGQVVHLQHENDMDAVTAVSGSGPAYVFHMIEVLADAGVAQGLPKPLALTLAKATVMGAGALAHETHETPEHLRRAVTSPNGTTQAGLEVLMDATTGLAPLMHRTVAAAAQRSRNLKT